MSFRAILEPRQLHAAQIPPAQPRRALCRRGEAELAAVTKAYNDQILDERVKEHVKDLNRAMEEQNKLVHQHVEELNRDLAEQRKHDEQAERARERIESLDVQAQRETLQREAARAGRMAELTVGQQSPMAMSDPEKRVLAAQREEAAARQAYEIRIDLALKLAGIKAQRIARETDSNEKAVLAAQARKNLFTELAQAEDHSTRRRRSSSGNASRRSSRSSTACRNRRRS